MEIQNSTVNDITKILELYRIATDFMKSKQQVAWPEFSKELVFKEIEELRQWKLILDDKIACIWSTSLNDKSIWGIDNNDPALYIHKIATHPGFRGQKLIKQIVDWAELYCKDNNLAYLRIDTVGFNEPLIKHYENVGFNFLGTKNLVDISDLPKHYSEGPVCLFQRVVKNNYADKR